MNAVLTPEQAQAITNNRVSEQLAQRADNDTVTYQGEAMPRVEALEKIEKARTTMGTAFFDPQDLVGELASANLKYEVRSSMAWSLDLACINVARDLFYSMRATKNDSIDDFNEFINDIAEIAANEAYNVDLGFEENAGKLQQLSMLLVLREQWHDLAESASKLVGVRTYAPKTLEELLASEKPQQLSNEGVINLEVLAKAMTRKHPERFDETLDLLKKQKDNGFKRAHESRKLTAPAVVSIFAVADYRRDVSEVAFHQLPSAVQLRLTAQTKGAVERAIANLSTRRGITTVAYGMLVVEAFDLIDQLDEVIEQMAARIDV